ncbi:MAG: metallophosphoesterase family protein [Candidatus Bruticola sp.]
MIRIALISDIHGRIEPAVLDHLQDCDYIVCAGDTESPAILAELEAIAPLTVVRGNCDWRPWADDLPKDAVLKAGELNIYVIHNIDCLSFNPNPNKIDVVVYGHTHRYKQYYENDVLYINPGSVSEPRGGQYPHMYILEAEGKKIYVKSIDV